MMVTNSRVAKKLMGRFKFSVSKENERWTILG